MELYKKYRPKTLAEVVGQPEAVKVLQEKVNSNKVPHAILFQGPSGTGKTTLGRILAKLLECSKRDFSEQNCADFRGIDMVRDIRARMGLAPIAGKCRVWLIDEAAKMTGDAQSAFLKMLEDTPGHVYFFLATTDPRKLLKTILTRCMPVATKPLSPKDMTGLLGSVVARERLQLNGEVIERIVECADGSARKALVLLDQVAALDTKRDQLAILLSSDTKKKAYDLAKAIMWERKGWKEVRLILRDLEDEEPEGIRQLVLKCARGSMLDGRQVDHAYQLILAFEGNFFDSGMAGLCRACYDAILAK